MKSHLLERTKEERFRKEGQVCMRRKNSGKRERGWKFLIAVQTSNFKTRAAVKKKKT